MRPVSSPHMAPLDRLLGGWRDILDGLRKVNRQLAAADGHCHCRHERPESACVCCAQTAARIREHCGACAAELIHVSEMLGTVEVDTVRFFPLVRDIAVRHGVERELIRDFSTDLDSVLRTFRELLSGIETHGGGCAAAHLTEVTSRAAALGATASRLDAALHPKL